jgi:hypothetical protein
LTGTSVESADISGNGVKAMIKKADGSGDQVLKLTFC